MTSKGGPERPLPPAPKEKRPQSGPRLTRRQVLLGLGITLGSAALGGIAYDLIARQEPQTIGLQPTPPLPRSGETSTATPKETGTSNLEQKLTQLLAGGVTVPDAKRFRVPGTTTPDRIGAISAVFSLDPHVSAPFAQAYFVGWQNTPDADKPTDVKQQHTVPFFGFQDVSGRWFAMYFDGGRPNDLFVEDALPDRSGNLSQGTEQPATVVDVGPVFNQQTDQCVEFGLSVVPPRSAFIQPDQQAIIVEQLPLAQTVYAFLWHVTRETPLDQMEIPAAVKPFLLTNPNANTLPTVVQSGAVPIVDNLFYAPPVK